MPVFRLRSLRTPVLPFQACRSGGKERKVSSRALREGGARRLRSLRRIIRWSSHLPRTSELVPSPLIPHLLCHPAGSAASTSGLSTTASSAVVEKKQAVAGVGEAKGLDAISSTLDAVKNSTAGPTGLPQLLDLFSQVSASHKSV